MTGSRWSGGPLDDGRSVSTVGEVVSGPGAGSRGRSLAMVLTGLAAGLGLLWVSSRPVAEPLEEGQSSTTAPSSATTPITGPSAAATPAVGLPSSVVVEGPALGEETGLLLLHGGDGNALQQLDLDSGELTRFGLEAHPTAVVGDQLILYRPEPGIVGWLPLRDIGQQVKAWKRGLISVDALGIEVLDAAAEPEGYFDSNPDDLGAGTWRRYDSRGGLAVFGIPADLHPRTGAGAGTGTDVETGSVGGVLDVLRTGVGLSERPDGVYRLAEDGFRRIADGRVVADDRQGSGSGASWLALVGTCGSDGPCDLVWVEADTGDVVDRPLPGIRPRRALVLAGDRWLLSVDWEGRAELLELATGRRIERDWNTARPTVSIDGRWLAEWTDRTTVSVSDLSGGGEPEEVMALTLADRNGPGSLLFAPSSR